MSAQTMEPRAVASPRRDDTAGDGAPVVRPWPFRPSSAVLVGVAVVSALVHVVRPDGVMGEVSYLAALGLASALAWRGVATRDAAGRRTWVCRSPPT